MGVEANVRDRRDLVDSSLLGDRPGRQWEAGATHVMCARDAAYGFFGAKTLNECSNVPIFDHLKITGG